MIQRLTWIDRMRGLAILSVVIQHLTYYYQNEFVYHKLIGIANMAVFFFISGYIWEKTARVGTFNEGFSYLMKKTIQIMLPFIVWTFFVTPYFFQTEWKSWNLNQIICEFTQPHLWFLLTLYGYSFYFILFRLIDKWGGVKSAILFWIIANSLLSIIWYKFGVFKFATLYMPYFAIGTILSNTNRSETILSNKIVTATSLFSIFLLLDFWESGHTNILNIMIKLLISIGTITVTYAICTRMQWNHYWDNFIIKCGKYSLSIYVMHWSFLHIFDAKPTIVQNELIAFVLILAIAILICYTCILFKDIISLFPTANMILFGERKNKTIKI